jgi:NAD(P)-dependent dehydrogenase (short-subunit alcohol dehydrogenase family)
MKLRDKVVVVTGGASGIGRGFCERFQQEGAKAVVVVDQNESGAKAVADAIGATAMAADVGREDDIVRVVRDTEAKFGPIDLFCSNAGIGRMDADFNNAASASNELWTLEWQVNVMAHVYAARALLPGMIARGSGYFLNTVSAAGLLTQIGSAVYSATKHAAQGFAENLAIAHRDHGIRVSVFCPQVIDTAMTKGINLGPVAADGVMTPAEAAAIVVDALDRETFMILSHPQVRTYLERKVNDYDRWIGGMARLRRSFAQ